MNENKGKKWASILFFCLVSLLLQQIKIKKETIMSEKEMNAYRFSIEAEPSDEMLSQLMKEVAQEARESNAKAMGEFFDSLNREARAIKREWSNRQTRVING